MAFNIRNSHTTNTAEQQHQNQQPPPQQQPSNHSLALQSCMNCHRRFPSIATKPKIVMLLWPSHESAIAAASLPSHSLTFNSLTSLILRHFDGLRRDDVYNQSIISTLKRYEIFKACRICAVLHKDAMDLASLEKFDKDKSPVGGNPIIVPFDIFGDAFTLSGDDELIADEMSLRRFLLSPRSVSSFLSLLLRSPVAGKFIRC
ncbi:hypothetical protein JHK85_031648 [Glycine max]|nr:hypothetical protein JHK85_031648 [Glycine max]